MKESISPLKKNVSYYSERIRNNILRNIEKYDWAKKERDNTVAAAEEVCKLDYDHLWSLLPTQDMPRSSYFRNVHGCINCGGLQYHYTVPCGSVEWKCVCPECGMTFPTNDFESYYKSSLDEHGNFIPGKGDKKYLKNILYPEKGEGWGVDDGFGYKSDNGEAYPYAAYIAVERWARYVPRKLLLPLCKAYVYTGEQKYADRAILLLDRASDLYPELDIVDYTPERGLYLAHGGGGQGKIAGCIEECIYVDPYLEAYDLIYPAFENMSSDILEYICKKSNGTKSDHIDIMCNIENGFILQMLPAVKTGKIRGNNGYHQTTLALAAVVLDHKEVSKEILDFVFRSGFVSTKRIEGGNVNDLLVRDVDRDGIGNEASLAYNAGWVECFLLSAQILDGYKITGTDISYDILGNVKFKKMFSAMEKLIISGKFSPNIGDAFKTGNPQRAMSREAYIVGFKRYRTEELALALYEVVGHDLDKLPKDIKDENPEEYIEDIKRIATEACSDFPVYSDNLTGYGMAVLQNTDKSINDKTALTMYYGRTSGHGHLNALDLGLYAYGINLSPDLGTPEYKDAYDMMRRYFIHHTISHNTVIADGMKQEGAWGGRTSHFDSGSFVKLASNEFKAYSGIKRFKRTSALISYDDNVSYAVDFFSVAGGKEHTYIFHAAESDSYETEGLSLIKQTDENGNYKGTLLSENIGWGEVNDESGKQYLTKVRRDDSPKGDFSVDWSLKDTWDTAESEGIHMKLHMLGSFDKVTLAVGTPPRNMTGNPTELEYVFVERKGEEELSSLFTSVIEPYDKCGSYIDTVEYASVRVTEVACGISAKALKVTMKNGRIDYIIYDDSAIRDKEYIIDEKYLFKGFFGVISVDKDGSKRIYAMDSTKICDISLTPHFSGEIVSFTKELTDKNEITVKLNGDIPESDLVGRYINVDNESIKNPSYKILSAEKQGEYYKLDIGDITLTCAYADPSDFSKGYLYDISEGDEFAIPLSYCIKR